MPEWKRRLLGMGLPCLLAFAFDIGLTMHGQPTEYWQGDYAHTTEGAPFQRKLYMIHPLAAVAGHSIGLGCWITLILLLPEVLAVILSIAIVFGHTVGGYMWFGYALTSHWYQTAHGMFFVSAVVLGMGLYWSLRMGARLGAPSTERRLPQPFRWGLIVVASGLACYMTLVPQ
jgi:hypothetical protein